MDNESKNLLVRWQSLEKDDGLRRASSVARLLWFAGLALFLFVLFAIVYRLHPAAIALAAAAAGWVTAESNALRTRLLHWPIFREYIDWNRVHDDLSDEQKET